jgi:tellurite resistance protein TehA-like permease
MTLFVELLPMLARAVLAHADRFLLMAELCWRLGNAEPGLAISSRLVWQVLLWQLLLRSGEGQREKFQAAMWNMAFPVYGALVDCAHVCRSLC